MLSHGTRPFEETYQLPSARSSDQLQEHIHVFSVRRQRERYARALEKLRKEIREGALRLLISQTSFIILGQDENTPPVSDALAMAAAMLEDARQNGSVANAEKVLLETYSTDGYLRAARPFIEKIRYVASRPIRHRGLSRTRKRGNIQTPSSAICTGRRWSTRQTQGYGMRQDPV